MQIEADLAAKLKNLSLIKAAPLLGTILWTSFRDKLGKVVCLYENTRPLPAKSQFYVENAIL